MTTTEDTGATHNCRLAYCDGHPRWMVIRAFYVDAPPQFSARPWWVYRPGDPADESPAVARFATHGEAVAYATVRARADQLATIQEDGLGG